MADTIDLTKVRAKQIDDNSLLWLVNLTRTVCDLVDSGIITTAEARAILIEYDVLPREGLHD